MEGRSARRRPADGVRGPDRLASSRRSGGAASIHIRQSIGGNTLHELALDRWGHDEADGLDGIVRDVIRRKVTGAGAYRTMA